MTNYFRETKIIVSEAHDEAVSAIFLGMQMKKKKSFFLSEIGHYLTIYLPKYFPVQERSHVGIGQSDSTLAYSSASQV